MTVPSTLFVASFDVAPEHQAAFERWYAETHIPDALGIPGFRAVHRYVSGGDVDNAAGAARYLNLYDVTSPEAFRSGWDTDYRRASSADFNRWGHALSNANVGLYVSPGEQGDG